MRENRKKILCIEDDHETAELIAEELADRGFEVQVTYDGTKGYSAILKSPPDLVLCDISMPVASGFDVLERLAAAAPRFRNMAFIFLTAMTDRNVELKARQLGADDFVTKPVDFDLLETIINARLACVARNDVWLKLVDIDRSRSRGIDVGGARQNVRRNCDHSGLVQTDHRFSPGQRPDQIGRRYPH